MGGPPRRKNSESEAQLTARLTIQLWQRREVDYLCRPFVRQGEHYVTAVPPVTRSVLTRSERRAVVLYCFNMADTCGLAPATGYVGLNLFDRFVDTPAGMSWLSADESLTLVYLTCMYMAMKQQVRSTQEESSLLGTMVVMGRHKFTSEDMATMEAKVACALEYQLNPPTIFEYCRYYTKLLPEGIADVCKEHEFPNFCHSRARVLLEDVTILSKRPSRLALGVLEEFLEQGHFTKQFGSYVIDLIRKSLETEKPPPTLAGTTRAASHIVEGGRGLPTRSSSNRLERQGSGGSRTHARPQVLTRSSSHRLERQSSMSRGQQFPPTEQRRQLPSRSVSGCSNHGRQSLTQHLERQGSGIPSSRPRFRREVSRGKVTTKSRRDSSNSTTETTVEDFNGSWSSVNTSHTAPASSTTLLGVCSASMQCSKSPRSNRLDRGRPSLMALRHMLEHEPQPDDVHSVGTSSSSKHSQAAGQTTTYRSHNPNWELTGMVDGLDGQEVHPFDDADLAMIQAV